MLAPALLAGVSNVASAQELSGFDCLIEPSALIRVSTREIGIIDTLALDRGDVVSKGQEVAKLESGVELIAVELARARANMRGTVDSRRAAAEVGKSGRESMS